MWQVYAHLKLLVPENLTLSAEDTPFPPFITYCGTEEGLNQNPWTEPDPSMDMMPMGPVQARAAKELQQSAHESAVGGEEVLGYAKWISSGSLAAGTMPLLIKECATHTGSRVWEGSLVQLQWACENQQLFAGRSVLELGAGCGLLGLAVARVAKPSEVVLSDFDGHFANDSTLPLVELLLENTTSNLDSGGEVKVSVWNLDWETPLEATCCWPVQDGNRPVVQTKKFEVIIGAELLYSTEGAALLLEAVSALLAEDGACYLLNNFRRAGVPEFVKGCAKLGLDCEQVTFEKPAANTIVYTLGDDEISNSFVLLKVTRLKPGCDSTPFKLPSFAESKSK